MTVRLLLPAALLLCLASPSIATPPGTSGAASTTLQDRLSFVVVRYRDQTELQKLGSMFQHMIVDKRAKTARLEATAADIAEISRMGMKVTIDQASTARIRSVETAMANRQFGSRSISGYACYRTVEETYSTMNDLVAAKPALATVVDIGPSWVKSRNSSSGYEMKVLRLTNSATNATRPNKPSMVIFGSIHAREYTPAELTTRFAEWLVNGYGTDAEATWLMDNYTFHLILQANPDGRKKAETGLSWRKNVNNTNGSCSASAVGTDLNRNFPFHWNTVSGGSSPNACNETYHGPQAQSEPETQNLVRYVAGTLGASGVYSGGVLTDRRSDAISSAAPDDYKGMFLDIHSYSQLVLWPWGDTNSLAPNSAALATLGRRMAFFNSYTPQQSVGLYATDGATDDTMYGLLGAPSYTIELGVSFFESCTTFQNTTLPQNLAALKYSARNLTAPYRYPSGPNTISVSTSSASVPAGTPVTISAILDDSQFNQSNGTEATHAIASAKLYLDLPPWEAGASGIAMSASDGSFNSTRETVSASLGTTGMAAGRHIVYVQGTDSSGKPGTPNAVLLTISGGGGGGNVAPVANFSASTSGLTATFTDSSTDSDGSIASRSWNFGDGTTSTLTSPFKTYSAAGTYPVSLTVTDNGGLTNTRTQSVTVSSSGAQTYSNGTDVTISDNATVESPIVVSGRTGNAPSATQVAVNIVHTYIGDLKVDLIAPDGSIYVLHNRSGGTTDNIVTTYPVNLSTEPLNGTWKLRVNDNATADTGRIDSWSVTF